MVVGGGLTAAPPTSVGLHPGPAELLSLAVVDEEVDGAVQADDEVGEWDEVPHERGVAGPDLLVLVPRTGLVSNSTLLAFIHS